MPIVCKTCGEHMEGDGYKVVIHCPHANEAQVACAEPDANPIHCQEEKKPACIHANRECVYESDDGGFERWECEDCGERWGKEIAQ